MRDNLKKELQAAGASAAEASKLSALAAKLPQLKEYKHIKNEGMVEAKLSRRLYKFYAGSMAGLVAGVFLILVSQPVLPTSFLYPVQKVSDNVAVDVHPQYRANVMMKRAQQVNALVANHAGSDEILATLSDYTHQTKIYKTTPHANYAAFEFCKTNLQQAASSAPPRVKQAIESSLRSLET